MDSLFLDLNLGRGCKLNHISVWSQSCLRYVHPLSARARSCSLAHRSARVLSGPRLVFSALTNSIGRPILGIGIFGIGTPLLGKCFLPRPGVTGRDGRLQAPPALGGLLLLLIILLAQNQHRCKICRGQEARLVLQPLLASLRVLQIFGDLRALRAHLPLRLQQLIDILGHTCGCALALRSFSKRKENR